MLFAQLKVASQGNVGIGTDPAADKKLNMDLNGAYEYGIYSRICSSRSWGMAIQAAAIYKYDRQCAIYAAASNASPATSGRAYGVLGEAGNRTPGYNYGIFGLLTGEQYQRVRNASFLATRKKFIHATWVENKNIILNKTYADDNVILKNVTIKNANVSISACNEAILESNVNIPIGSTLTIY